MTQNEMMIKNAMMIKNGKIENGIAICSVTNDTNNRMLYIDVLEDMIYITDSKIYEESEKYADYFEMLDNKLGDLYNVVDDGWLFNGTTMIQTKVSFYSKTPKRLKKLVRNIVNRNDNINKWCVNIYDDCVLSKNDIMYMACQSLLGAANNMINNGFDF